MRSEASASPSELWQLFLHAVKDKLSAHVLRTWLRPVHCAAFDGRTATLEVRDQFFRDWLADHYLDFIRTGLTDVACTPVEVRWAVNPALADAADETHDQETHGPHEVSPDQSADAAAKQDDARPPRLEGAAANAPNTERGPEKGAAQAGKGKPVPRPDDRGRQSAERSAQASKRSRAPARTGAGAAAAKSGRAQTPVLSHSSGAASPRDRPRPTSRPGARNVQSPSGFGPAGQDDEDARQLNKRYLFDNFVQGPSNQFAFAACHAAAQNPGRSYNPLFIYGGVGLGKTHLLSAIGHHILAQRADAQIIYTSSEQFTNEVINAVLSSRLSEFRAKYLNHGDAILVDDIQLIAGKERTQHEFFHIFNTLYDSQRQIVVTSDKLPHEIPDIEERLRNRFQWGLIADVQPPEIETRIAILRKKAEGEKFELHNDVAFFLARSIRSNVRELEGALVRIMAHASLTGTPVTVEYARATLSDILQNVPSEVSVESIQKTVANYFSIRVSELKGSRRQKALVRARQMAMYLCRKHLGCSYPELGSRFGDKDHTTVLASCSRVISCLSTDVNMRMQLDEIEQRMSFEQHQ